MRCALTAFARQAVALGRVAADGGPVRMVPISVAKANPAGWTMPWLLVPMLLGSLVLTALGGPAAGHE